MPIQSDDIKLLRSAVMADVPEGGGAATGIEIIDGQSNNIFPDTSTDDRAAGRVNFRKVFGAAHTDDTDTLLGASFAVLEPPEDPLVHVTLFETPGWADTRATAKEIVERYIVKGPRLLCNIMDTHYAGSLLLQLFQVGGANFPSPGDAIAVRNPDGAEQYVRVTKVTVAESVFNAAEGGTVTSFPASVAVCELAQALKMDVFGPSVARVFNAAAFAQVFTTTIASGAAFYGVKPLAVPATVGDRSITALGGIYTPLVPAATVETPLTDIYPLTARMSLSRTAMAPFTLPAQTLTMQPGTVLRLPTAVQPGSLTVTRGSTTFTDDGNGVFRQGTTAVGVVDYRGKSITLDAGAPAYGSASTVISYLPATPSGAAAHSRALNITANNQGLAFTAAFEPRPAPGTFAISYMAQGRWYELTDNGNGKLSGADSSYGTGTINYASGSVAFTLGAVPDVGSAILYAWGDADTAVPVAPANLPSRVTGVFSVDERYSPGSLTINWSRGASNYTATVSVAGVISGHATGRVVGTEVRFAPAVLPDGPVGITYSRFAVLGSGFTRNGNSLTLGSVPVQPGSVRFSVVYSRPSGPGAPATVLVQDDGTGHLRTADPRVKTPSLGVIDYATGVIVMAPNAILTIQYQKVEYIGGWIYVSTVVVDLEHTLGLDTLLSVTYAVVGASVAEGDAITPSWRLPVPMLPGYSLKTSALAFTVGGVPYSAEGGIVSAGWSATTGAGPVAGAASSDGAISLSLLPFDGNNTVVWSNVAQDQSVPLVSQGVFRVATAPIKVGVFQIQAGPLVGTATDGGVISGDGWTGTVDFQRGIVQWQRTQGLTADSTVEDWLAAGPVPPEDLTYNAVFLQYVPIDGNLLGLETARLPLDGRVPIYRAGGQVIVHNTLTTQLPNPLVKGTAYSLGRERIAAVVVRTAAGVKVPGNRYEVDFNAGTIVFPPASDLAGLDQPFTAHHRIEDELMLLRADITGKLDLVAGLTHNYPAGTSYVSSKLRKGDLFARAFGYTEQSSWTGVWSNTLIGSAPTANYNDIDFPIQTTNRGAITERWVVIFTGATQVRVVGENVGQVLTGVSINGAIEPLNPQTGAPYFSIPALGWGGGWAVGNALRFNTSAAGGPAWVARTVLQGPATVASDAATIAFRSDVDA